jgi:hypothetical protein
MRQYSPACILSFLAFGCGVESDQSVLNEAAYAGDIATVIQLLENDADVNTGGGDDDSPLVNAIRGNHIDTAKILLEYGADSSNAFVKNALALSADEAMRELVSAPQDFEELEGLFQKDIAAFRRELSKNREKGKKIPLPSKYGVHEKYYPKFRAIRSNHSALPIDRGKALLWCFVNFRGSDVTVENPGKIQTDMANALIKDWGDEDWASGLAIAITRNKTMDGFDADSALASLESTVASPARKADAAYQRANLHRRGDSQKLNTALIHFIENYPSDDRVTRAKGYLKNAQLLTVGNQAPEFTGSDADGNTIRLSDYRGKVTFIVFWGFW